MLSDTEDSQLPGNGVQVQEIPGHSQISMTLGIYSHVLPTIQKEAMHRLNAVLKG